MAYSSVRATLGGADIRKTARQVRKVKRRRPTTTINAELGGEGIAQAAQAAERAAKSAAKRARKEKRRAKARRQEAKALRALQAIEPPKSVTRARERQIRQIKRRTKPDVVPMSAAGIVSDTAERVARHGVVGEVDRKLAGLGRELLTGSKNPSFGELALAAAPVPALKGARIVRTILRGEKALKTGKKAAQAKRTVEAARTARKTEREAARAAAPTKLKKARATGKGMSAQARKRLRKTEVKAAAKRSAARSADRALKSATSPIVAAAAASPGDVGHQVRENIEALAKADPGKTAATTARAVPASLAYLASLGYGVGKAATGDTDSLVGTLKAGEEGLKALEPIVSGDSEEIAKAMESDIGYWFTPLAPRGAVTRPARAVGRGVTRAAQKVPGTARITERGARKRIATAAARETQAERYRAGKAQEKVEKPLRRVKKAYSFKGEINATDAVSILARYGISRKSPVAQLQKVKRSLGDSKAARPDVTTRKVIDYLERNPDVLKDKNLWKSVDEYKRQARDVETSPRAKYLAQARQLGIRKPEERVPAHAPTRARTRDEAWREYRARESEVKRLRRQGKAAEAKALSLENKDLYKALDPYMRPDVRPSSRVKRTKWDRRMVEDFIRETREAAQREGYEEPAWVAERGPKTEGEIAPAYPANASKLVEVKTGRAEVEDLADRSLRSLVAGSIHAPRIQRGLSRFVRGFLHDNAQPVGPNGRKVITGEEWNALPKKVRQRHVLLPSRQFKRALESEDFDLPEFHSEVSKRLTRELHNLEDTPGSKYVVVRKDAAEEFLDQIDPHGSRTERGLSALSMVGSRTILGLSPAWVIAQVAAEGLQTAAAIGNPARATKALYAIRKLRKTNPRGYESFAAYAGESVASFESPHTFRVDMEGGTQQRFYEAGQAIRKTRAGRFLYNAGSLRLLGLFDRWKSGKYRSVILAANVDKRLNRFTNGLSGVLRKQDEIARKLKGKPLDEQLAWLSKEPKELRQHLDYLDDVMGNWQAFTRFERSFAPALIFYPFLRMSLRWTLWSYPRRHPVKAQALYLLAQQNAEDLEKLLGSKPSFIEQAMPVLRDREGEPTAVLPAGRRFATPGLNTIVESIGEDNIAGVFRGLNPALSIPIYGLTGINPMSGEQDVPGDPKERALHALRQLLSLPAPARAVGLNRVGTESSPISERFDAIDPNRSERSLLMPFLPLSGDRAKMQHDLSRTLDESSAIDSELGQFSDLVERYGREKAMEMLRKDIAAGKALSSGQPDDPEFEKLSEDFYGTKYGTAKKGSSSSSSDSSGSGWYGGSSSSSSSSSTKKSGWYR